MDWLLCGDPNGLRREPVQSPPIFTSADLIRLYARLSLEQHEHDAHGWQYGAESSSGMTAADRLIVGGHNLCDSLFAVRINRPRAESILILHYFNAD